MTATLTVEGKEFGRNAPITSRTINFPPALTSGNSSMTMRDLITYVVQEEVDAFHKRQQERSIFRVMTAAQIAVAATKGKVDPAPHEAQAVNVHQAVATALQAFEDGLFFAFIEREQKESLDEIVVVKADSTLTFMRLVPLAGG